MTFNGLSLLSAPGRVMTPRPASERLVAAAVARLGDRHARVADVGTGSGAIAVAIARECPDVEMWATDTSRCASLLARTNVRGHGLEDRVTVCRCDLLDDVPGPLDLIVANLPYVPASTALEHPDLWAEPFESVFAPGDGLDPYRRLAEAAWAWLADDGELLLQLHRRVLAVARAELPVFGVALAPRTRAPSLGASKRRGRSARPLRPSPNRPRASLAHRRRARRRDARSRPLTAPDARRPAF